MSRLKNALSLVAGLVEPRSLDHVRRSVVAYRRTQTAECPNCGYVGQFKSGGVKPRLDACCPSCRSMERHRLLALAVQRGFLSFADRDVLHFAPEPAITKLVKAQHPRFYLTADIRPERADRMLNIERIDLEDASFDRIICSHVLEHVDDRLALSEMCRVLRPGGKIVIMVPIVEGWVESYENPAIQSEADRDLHFGQDDHVRHYGGEDFRNRVRSHGLALEEFTAGGPDSVRYNLMRGEKVFLATK